MYSVLVMDDTLDTTSEIKEQGQEQAPQMEGDATDQSTVYLSLENLIKTNLTTIETLQTQFREQKEMVDNVLENDQTYRAHLEQAKEANRVKSATKQQIMKRPEVVRIAEKMKELKEEIKETQATLSDLLQEFQKVSGTNIIEREDGQILEIVSVSKLVRK